MYRRPLLNLVQGSESANLKEEEPPLYLSLLAVTIPAAAVFAGVELIKLLQREPALPA
jgi:hypothetical protein